MNPAPSDYNPDSRVDQLITKMGLWITDDDASISAAVESVLASNPKAVSDIRGGNQKAIGSLIGQVLKHVKAADPKAVRDKLMSELEIPVI